MFSVILEMPDGTTDSDIEKAMPEWWIVDNTLDANVLKIFRDSDTQNAVGLIKRLLNKIVIKIDETTVLGNLFWQEFAMKYPELNPFDLRCGVLYRVGEQEVYELDEIPVCTLSEVFDIIVHYELLKTPAFFVSFFLGDWHPNEEIRVQSFEQILVGRHLGPKLSLQYFRLGLIET